MCVVDSLSKWAHFIPTKHYNHLTRHHLTLPYELMETTWPTSKCYLRLRPPIYIWVHSRTLLSLRYTAHCHNCIPPTSWQSDWMSQSRARAVPLIVCEWMTRWLGWTASTSWIPVQQLCTLSYKRDSIHIGLRDASEDGLQITLTSFEAWSSQQVHWLSTKLLDRS